MRRWAYAQCAAAGAFAVACLVRAGDAQAKSSFESLYGVERTWNAGLRYVRVDLGLKVTEKDEANGFLLFEYASPESGRAVVPGSLEFIKLSDGRVRVLVQIARMPGYHEQVLADGLARKLRADYGEPPARGDSGSSGSPAKDAGADASASDKP